MNLGDILSNEAIRRHEFPVTEQGIYLAHAAVCPLPRRVTEAVAAYATEAGHMDQEKPVDADLINNIRAQAAGLLGANPEEIALVGPTSLGLSYVARGLSLGKRDNFIIYPDDYPSNVYPWMALAQRGVEIRSIKTAELGRIEVADVMRLVDANTRLVALSSCHFISGHRLDHAAIGNELRGRHIRFCLDAIQTLGAFPTPVEGIDFLASDAHKWLLGPCAAGILYVRRECQSELQPITHGWNNLLCPEFITLDELNLQSGARRYEPGSYNWLGLVGLNAALQLIQEIGVQTIARELWRKREWLVSHLQEKNYAVLQAKASPSQAGGMISVRREDQDMPDLHARLAAAKITTSLRTDRLGRHYLRLSPHFYNTDEELEEVMLHL